MKVTQFFSALYDRFKRQISYARSVFHYSGGQPVTPDTAMKVAAFYRGVTYIATQMANLPWEVKDYNQNILDKDRVAYLLNVAPNPEMNAHSFRIAMVANALIYGNFIAEIQRNYYGQPVALWPICQYDIYPWRDEEGTLWYRVAGGSRVRPGEDLLLAPSDVFHIKNINSLDGIVGQGLIYYAVNTLGITLGADAMASSLFSNMGMPSGVISVKGALSVDAAKRLKDNWEDAHGNKGDKKKAGGTAVLEQDASFTPINMSPNLLQFLESRKFGVLELCRFFGLPPSKLFDTEAATYNNIEQSNLEVATDTLNTWARALEAEGDNKLLNGQFAGKYTELDLYEVFRGDMKTRGQYFKDMMQTGSITPNQIRRKEGMAPYKGGDEYYIATNNYTPASMVKEVIQAQITKSNTPNTPPKTEDEKELDALLTEYLKNRKTTN